ncbi:hypothetical protein [Pedobacter sp. Leaf170]|uniref:hypothetical protein n=1 Tax=Pedobacter sp. Leaf170 TaxID=2876558 RepID=UPI001E5C87DF|nr:hypothetical protein [Pedobacter sp. Leaf170]
MSIQKEKPKDWANFPWQKAVIMLLTAVSVLFGIIIQSYREKDKSHDERINYLRLYITKKEEETKTLTQQLYNCKDESARYFRTQDSTNRSVLDGPAKELLKQLKR